MPPPQPHCEPDGVWPSCDDQQPGVSIRPLNHADLATLLAHLDHHQHPGGTVGSGGPAAPVLAVRVRASVGRPGASAHAEYRRRRAAELAAWAHSLPWRVVAIVAASGTSWLAAAQVVSHLGARGGHFAAWEEPELFSEEVRAAFRSLR